MKAKDEGIARKERAAALKEPAFVLDHSRMFAYRAMVEGIFRREGPSKSRVRVTSKEASDQPIAAGIDPETWDVDFVLRDGLSFAGTTPLRRFLSRFGIQDPISSVLCDVGYHEIGHWEFPRRSGFGCPFDKVEYYTSFIMPIHEELQRSGKFSAASCWVLSQRFANAVTDVIDNFNVASSLAMKRRAFAGQSLFWYVGGMDNGGYSSEYTLFVKLNLALFGNKADQGLLRRFMEEGAEMGRSVKRLARLFGSGAVYSRQNWEPLARAYAQEALKHIKDEETSEGFSLQYSAGDCTAGQGQAQPQPGQGPGKGDKGKEGAAGNSGNELGKDLGKGDIERIMMGRKAGQGIPFFIDRTKGLDAYYSALAKRIPIKAAGRLPGAQMELVALLHEPFDEGAHDPKDISMGRLYVDPLRGTVVPSVVKSRLAVEIPIRKEKRHLPDFLMSVIDSSGSMMGQGERSIVPWGDQSYYHYALLSWYGIKAFFESERILHKIGIGAAIFSDTTLSAQGLEEVKRLLLNPASGGTRLDISKVMEAMKGRENVILSMMSDGEIMNWHLVRDEFIALARRNQFFMIQIGRKSRASMDMEAAGLLVKNVGSHEEAFRLSIDLTVQKYRSVIASGVAAEAKKFRELG